MIKRGTMKWDSDFTIIPNAWARDERLSRKARGLLLELASHRPGWEITLPSLVERGPEGIAAIRGAIKELTDLGYLKVERVRGEGGKLFGVDYMLQDPFTEIAVLPTSAGPTLDKPTLDNPHYKKTMLLEDHPEEHEGRRKRLPSVVPEGFELSGSMRDYYLSKMPVGNAELEFETFLNWHMAKGTKAVNWEASWRTWVLKAVQFNKSKGIEPLAIWDLESSRDPYADVEEVR